MINNTIHVFPSNNNKWIVAREKSKRASKVCSSKDEAIDYAYSLVKKHRTTIMIHREDGKIVKIFGETERTFIRRKI